MSRPAHYADYEDMLEVVPGVFVATGDGVYIVDDKGEVVMWNHDEIAEDGEAFTAAINAVAIATKLGASAVRKNLTQGGLILEKLIKETKRTRPK